MHHLQTKAQHIFQIPACMPCMFPKAIKSREAFYLTNRKTPRKAVKPSGELITYKENGSG